MGEKPDLRTALTKKQVEAYMEETGQAVTQDPVVFHRSQWNRDHAIHLVSPKKTGEQ